MFGAGNFGSVVCGRGIWWNTAWQQCQRRSLWNSAPGLLPTLSSAAGTRAWDTEGRQYLDFSSWDAPLGHSPPSVIASLAAQAATLGCASSSGLAHAGAALTEEALCRVLRADAAVLLEGRGLVESFVGNVARRTVAARGSKAETVLHVRGAPLSQSPAAHRLPSVGFGDIAALEAALRGGGVAAVVIEPLQLDAGGFLPIREGFFRLVAAACRRAGALFVMDERRSALGRAGPLLVCDEYVVGASKSKQHQAMKKASNPDLVLVGRGIVSGLTPSEAVLARGTSDSPLISSFRAASPRPWWYSACSPVSCAAAQATLRLAESTAQRTLRADAENLGSAMRKRLRRAVPGVDRSVIPITVRGRGLISAVTLGHAGDGIARQVALHMAQNGVLSVCEENVVFLCPPLGVTERELTLASRVIRNAIQHVGTAVTSTPPQSDGELLETEMGAVSAAAAAYRARESAANDDMLEWDRATRGISGEPREPSWPVQSGGFDVAVR